MNRLLVSALVILTGCPSQQGSEGPQGPQGPQGATGERGPQGPQGPNGVAGADGMQGPIGPMGVQGPMGAVLVLDGGVVTGPPGSSVISTPVPVGDALCAFGGVRLTQLSDAGVTHVCNGATGATGPQGMIGLTGPAGAQGPIGMTGPAGTQGPIGMTGPAGAQGPIGMTGPAGTQGPIGMTGPAGTQGPIGMTGPAGTTGSAGPQGIQGATGPAGPAGAVLYVDGGIVLARGGTGRPTYAGITVFTTNGAASGPSGQLGRLSMNARCNAEFAGSHICTDYEWAESTPTDAVPASGAWLEYSNTDNSRTSSSGGCTAWTNGTSAGGSRIITTQSGSAAGSPTSVTCANVLPIACCRAPTAPLFRGITSYLTNGAPTGPGAQIGRLAMNARCHAEFPGAHICTDYEWAESTPNLPVPAPGAWLEYSNTDNTRTSSSGGCTSWTNGTSAGGSRIITTPSGSAAGSPSTVTCANVLPIACCE